MDLLKRNFIQSIVNDLSKLNGTEFEYLCKIILQLILGTKVTLRGHNLYAKPVGYSVDLITNNFQIVGQCGTDSDYFDGLSTENEEKNNSSKPIKDIEAVVKNSPQARLIYLFTNVYATGGKLSILDKAIKIRKFTHDIEILDSERIAETIYNNIEHTALLEEVMEYLPTAEAIFRLFPQTGKLPNFRNFYYIRNEEESIKLLLMQQQVIQLYGISGIGKTELAIKVSQDLSKQFDTVIWLDGDSNRNFNIDSVKIDKFNKKVNLAYAISSYRTLVIIDNCVEDPIRIVNIFGQTSRPEGRLIITAVERVLPINQAIHVGELTFYTARNVLNEVGILGDTEVNTIIKAVGGFPLALQLIKSLLKNSEYTVYELITELENLPDMIDVERMQRIAERVLGKHLKRFETEFALISYLNSTTFSNIIFAERFNKIALKNLQTIAVISSQSGNVSYLHKIVLESIKKIVDVSKYRKSFDNSIEGFLDKENNIKSSEYFSFVVTHRQLLEQLYNNTSTNEILRKNILYAQIQSVDTTTHKQALIKEIDLFDLSGSSRIDVLLAIENCELTLMEINRKTDKQNYETVAYQSIERLSQLSLHQSDHAMDHLVQHHIGKVLFWIGKTLEAKQIFKKLLASDPNADHSRLQLARILLKEKDTNAAIEHLDIALTNRSSTSSLAVTLALYETLGNQSLSDLRKKYIDNKILQFMSLFGQTLDLSFDYPIKVLSKLANHLSFNHPQEFSYLCTNLPTPDNANNNASLMESFANIQFAYYKCLKYGIFENKETKMSSAQNLSERYYIEMGLDSRLVPL